MDNSTLKNNILKARLEKGLSQADMAEKINISQTSYHKIEKGTTFLISRRISDIASVLGLSDEELVLGYNVPDEQEHLKKIEESKALYKEIIKEKEKRISELENIIKDKKAIIDLLEDKLNSKE